MAHKVVSLHNYAINYRLPLFNLIQDKFGPELEYWIYNDKPNSQLDARYFGYISLLKIRFSISCIVALLFTDKPKLVVLWGSQSYEMPFFWIILKVRRIPYVFWTETWDWGNQSLKDRVFLKILSAVAKGGKYALYAGQKVHELYSTLGITTSRQGLVPDSSINTDPINLEYIKTLPLDEKKIKLVFMGRSLERKGLIYLIEAVKQLPRDKYQLLVGGPATDIEYYQQCLDAAAGQDNIKFIGNIAKENAQSFLSTADIYIYPSINAGMAEPWGLAINEAVALGKPVISTTAVAAAFDLISHGKNGFIVPEKDSTALKLAIEKATKLDPKVLAKISHEKNEIYSYENMANQMVKFIRLAINE